MVEYYRGKGFDIVSIDRREPKIPSHKDLWVKCDVTNYQALREAVLRFAPDFIVNMAAKTELDGKTLHDYDASITGVENILKIASELKSLKKLLITSSMLVCHRGYVPKGQHDYTPTTLYGESKVKAEELVWKYRPKCDWAILRPTSIWGPWFGTPYRNFFDVVKARRYVHTGHKACTKTYGYIDNAIYQIDRILFTPTTDEDNKVFYIGDMPPVNIEEWANEIAGELGYTIPRIPYWVMRIAALFGDLMASVGIRFPMTSFRLKNMTTDNIMPLENTMAIAPDLPVDRLTGVKRTLEWMVRT